MARPDDLTKFSKKHKIKIASIADLIAYRLKNEKLVYKSYSKHSFRRSIKAHNTVFTIIRLII